MPNVTTAPTSPLARLKAKLHKSHPPTARDRARWRRIASDRSRVLVTDEAPDVSRPVSGLVECAPPASFPIDEDTAAWFGTHGGTRAVLKALRAYRREREQSAAPRQKAASRKAAKRRH